jgi:hypothetical protein
MATVFLAIAMAQTNEAAIKRRLICNAAFYAGECANRHAATFEKARTEVSHLVG